LPLKTFIVALLLSVVPAAAQTGQDPVSAGYARLWAGNRVDAFTHFESLHAKDPQNLAVWFGLLFAHQARIEYEKSLSASFEPSIAEFLRIAEMRYERSGNDTEALFSLAQGYLLRSTYRIENDKGIFGAARDAAKAKGYADSYIRLHPEHGDAYLVLGLYNYYVDIAPTFIKMLRVVLFLPPGNRAEGLKQIERAARDGSLFAPLAEGALADIYGELEGRLGDATAINERLVQRFPSNAELRFDLALRYSHPIVEAYDRAAEQYSTVIQQKEGSSIEDLEARYRATLGLAALRRTQWRLEEAVTLLTPVVDQNVGKPDWVAAAFLLRRANYRALLNDPDAIRDVERVTGDKRMADAHKAAWRQFAFINGRRKTDEATVYAALVPGNRLLVEHRWDDALRVFDQVGASYPNNWQVKYRRAYLEFARGNYDAAARGLNDIVAARTPMPAWLKAAAMLNLAWTDDIAGRRAEALKLYKRIVDDYENEAAADAARVGLISPYKRVM
jgi:Tetratricopeptide repeat